MSPVILKLLQELGRTILAKLIGKVAEEVAKPDEKKDEPKAS
jgi:hypothetical protein